MAKPFRGLIWGAQLHFQSNRFISNCAQQDFRLMEFLLVGIVDALALVKNTTTRSIAKTKLIERLEGRYISQINLPASKTSPAMKKLEYRQEWLDGKIPDNIPEIQYCVESLLYLTDEEIETHQQYIRLTLLRIYKNSYENVSPIIASNLRKAICRIDEALYLKN